MIKSLYHIVLLPMLSSFYYYIFHDSWVNTWNFFCGWGEYPCCNPLEFPYRQSTFMRLCCFIKHCWPQSALPYPSHRTIYSLFPSLPFPFLGAVIKLSGKIDKSRKGCANYYCYYYDYYKLGYWGSSSRTEYMRAWLACKSFCRRLPQLTRYPSQTPPLLGHIPSSGHKL